MTVLDMLTKSLAELNLSDANTAISFDDAQFSLDIFNDWINALQTEGLTIHQVTRATWALTTAVTYTVGVGGVVNVARPVSPNAIEAIGYQDTSTTPAQETLLGEPLTIAEYAEIPQKTLTGSYPTSFYYNPTFGSTGFGTLYPFPIPTLTTLQGVIYVPSPVTEFAAVTDTLSLPPGYRRFIRTNLAVELASAYQVQLPSGLQKRADDSKANVKRVNIRLEDMSFDQGGRPYNIALDR